MIYKPAYIQRNVYTLQRIDAAVYTQQNVYTKIRRNGPRYGPPREADRKPESQESLYVICTLILISQPPA